MAEKIINLRDTNYEVIQSHAFLSNIYKLAKEASPKLREPIFTLKKLQPYVSGLTYRKINDWDNKNLISGIRDKGKSGWRKFSIIDSILLCIITDLKNIGFDSERIHEIVSNISNGTVLVFNTKTKKQERYKFLELEYFITLCVAGLRILFLIDSTNNAIFLTEKKAIDFYVSHDESFPLVVLPFFKYVRKLH